ncbi:MAG: nucleoside deaminase [Bacteroidota bacterium]
MNEWAQDEMFIRQVNELALQSAQKGFAPFAALLVKDGKVVAASLDKCIQYSDPTSHAELILISEFCREHQLISLEGYSMYCNVEPCVMCSGAIHWARISRLVYGVNQKSLQSVSKGKQKPSCRELINVGKEKTTISGPILEEEGLRVLRAFPFRSKAEQHRNHWKGDSSDE